MTTRAPLVCYACTNCIPAYTNYQTCLNSQPYCYVQRSGSLVVGAGCAATCTPGAQISCCTSSYCNYPQFAKKSEVQELKESDEVESV